MEDCRTPTFQHTNSTLEFIFSGTPTVNSNNINSFKDVQNLSVNKIPMRCYTPTLNNFNSPGLSPIYATINSQIENAVKTTVNNNSFKKPSINLRNSTIISSNNSPSNLELPINLNSSTKSENESNEAETTSNSNSSKNSISILDHTINVAMLLQNIGLGEYAKAFEDANTSTESFLKMKQKELKSMGLKTNQQFEKIMKMQKELNAIIYN